MYPGDKIRIAVSGSTGMIGQSLLKALKEDEIISLTRKDFMLSDEEFSNKLRNIDAVINLAGVPIIKRWTKKNKKEIYDSRINTTKKIVKALGNSKKPVHFISASAIGIYDTIGKHSESSQHYSRGFLYTVISDWEKEAMMANSEWITVTIIRLGIVLARQATLIKRLKIIYRMGLGGPIGDGTQILSFIHIDDLVQIIRFIIEKEIKGIINVVTGEPVSNKIFSKTFAKYMHKPSIFRVPVFFLKILFGKGAEVIYKGQYVIPGQLLESNFIFRYPDIESALKAVIVD